MAWESASGAKSSHQMPRYDLIYVGFLERLAVRLGYGAAKHGENNYQQGVGDAVYRRDRVNHLIVHAHKLAGATDPAEIDKHLGAIAANCQIIAFLDDAVPEREDLSTNGPSVVGNIPSGNIEQHIGGEPV